MQTNSFNQDDALLIIDVQNDFLPGGTLAVQNGDDIIEPLNRVINIFESNDLPIFFTKDWHTKNHCSFQAQNGLWPSHCVQNTWGSEFSPKLYVPKKSRIILKAATSEKDSYSGFESTDLHAQLQTLKISRLFVGGLATDYCVLKTVKDACHLKYKVHLFLDAVKGVNVKPDDEKNALKIMESLGVLFF